MPTSNFEIDLNQEFPTLQNAPIVEAAVQFDAPPSVPFEQAELKNTLEGQFTDFKLQPQMQHESGFRGSPDGNVEMHHKSHWDGFRLNSIDGKYICQWKRNALVFSRLQPYETWPNSSCSWQRTGLRDCGDTADTALRKGGAAIHHVLFPRMEPY